MRRIGLVRLPLACPSAAAAVLQGTASTRPGNYQSLPRTSPSLGTTALARVCTSTDADTLRTLPSIITTNMVLPMACSRVGSHSKTAGEACGAVMYLDRPVVRLNG